MTFLRKEEWGHFHQAQVDIECIDQAEQFPEYFTQAQYIKVTLFPGMPTLFFIEIFY